MSKRVTPKPKIKVESTRKNGVKKSVENEARLAASVSRTKEPSLTSPSTSNGTKKKTSPYINSSDVDSQIQMLTGKPSVTSLSSVRSSSRQQTSTKHRKAPETPPSGRVTKTQFYPSKSIYSNAIKRARENDKDVKTSPSRSDLEIVKKSSSSDKTKKTSPSQKHTKVKSTPIVTTKIKHEATTKRAPSPRSGQEDSTSSERPRTATLKRGSIVNSNIAGPDIPISETPSLTSLDYSYEEAAKEDNYEDEYADDFESYESDFEEYQSSDSLSTFEDNKSLSGKGITSSDSDPEEPVQTNPDEINEERMLDSGNFDLPDVKHVPLLNDIKELEEGVIRSNMASLSDEGFEEGKGSLQSTTMQFVNFADAQKKLKQNKTSQRQKKRGEEILNMIRLDYYNFNLIDMPAIPYEHFIKTYGKVNSVQVSTQTHDEDTDEEIQTDFISTSNKWTQFPVAFSKIDTNDPNYLEIYKSEFRGSGDDNYEKTNASCATELYRTNHLETFLSRTSEIVLNILNESFTPTSEHIHSNSRPLPFSKGYIPFNTKAFAFLDKKPITFVSFYSTSNIKILTVHGRNKEVYEHNDDVHCKSIVCIWSVSSSEEPETILVVTGEVNVCCFISDLPNVIFGGLSDGSVTSWEMKGNNTLQNHAILDGKHIQEPNYVTDIESGHCSSIVSLEALEERYDTSAHSSLERNIADSQICSLDENGLLIIWGVIVNSRGSTNISDNHSTVPWNQYCLVKNATINLKDSNPDLSDLLCSDMKINPLDPHHIYVSTNYGYIIHSLSSTAKARPKRYNLGTNLQANCIEPCPFSPLYFLAGHDDSIVALYSRSLERPLTIMSNKDDNYQTGIDLLAWSHHRPCVFYAKDRNNVMHIWDLAKSNLFPIYSIPFKDTITCMKTLPAVLKEGRESYMVLATANGSIHLHVLSEEHGPINEDLHAQEIKTFSKYVSRL